MKRPLISLYCCFIAAALFTGWQAAADTLNVPAVADTFVLSSSPDANAGGHGWFDAGTDGAVSVGVRRGLIKFDLGAIPTGAMITSAVLKLTMVKVPLFGPVDSVFDLRRVNVGWGEGTNTGNNGALAAPGEATWNARLNGTAVWTVPGALGDVSATVSASVSVGSVANTEYFWSGANVLVDVVYWRQNPALNFGWLLTSQAEAEARSVRGFGSRQAAIPSTAPILQVGYTPVSVITNPIAQRVPKGGLAIELQTVADGMASPLGMAVPDDGSGRMFVYDQDGKVWIVTSAGRSITPLLDVSGRLMLLGAYDERGLLGLAVHPNFAQNPLIYTYTSETNNGVPDFATGLGTTNNHQSIIAEWRISAGNPNQVDVSSRREILRIDEPQSNHNGGAMHFGPDGYLYVSVGDGGQANDVAPGHVPGGNAQDINVILGKMLRLNVNGANSANGKYGIPASNPFVGTSGLDEIFAYGLRNAFSFSFDRQTGQLYLPDVGQNRVEEINIATAGGNYGWNLREGSFWFDPANGSLVTAPVRPPPPGMIDPIAQYDHDDGLAVIGGYVYRGAVLPQLAGRYVFGDWGSFAAPSGRLFYLDATNGVNEFQLGREDRLLRMWIRGFGEGPDGELYVFATRWLGPSGQTGRMMKIIPLPAEIVQNAPIAAGGSLAASWTGGFGPFSWQRKLSLSDQNWQNVVVTDARTAAVSQQGDAGFFRVKDAGREPAMPLTAYLSGAAERPPTGSAGTGLGIFALDGNTLTFNVRYSGLSGSANNAHIHGPSPASAGAGVLIDLGPFNGGSWGTSGTLSGVIVLTDTQKAHIQAGRTYVNIHSTAVGSGEIRGQIAPVNHQVELSGAAQVPPVPSAGRGVGNLMLVGNQLTFDVAYGGLSGPAGAAHIHGPASQTNTASVLVDLAPYNGGGFGTSGRLSGSLTLAPDQIAALIDGLTYINLHTPNNGSGEIRGQILPHVNGVPMTAILSGLAEKPVALTNSAFGSGSFSLEGQILTFAVSYGGLSGCAVAAHIHGPTNTTQNAPVLIDLADYGAFGASGTLSGSVLLTARQRDAMLSGLTYVNIHTALNSGGELRGQIVPVLMTAGLSGKNERPTAVPSPGSGLGTFALVRDQLTMAVTYSGLVSAATMAHIHGPAGFTGSGGILVDLAPLNGGAFGTAGSFSGTAVLTIPQLLNVIDGQTYLNVHSATYGSGEIRGHLIR